MNTRLAQHVLCLAVLVTALLADRPPSAGAGPPADLQHRIYIPVQLRQQCMVDYWSVDVALVLDASRSMLSPLPSGTTRLDAAITGLGRLGTLLWGGGGIANQVAVVGFNDQAWVQLELTSDVAAFQGALAGITDRLRSGSRIDLGLATAASVLTGSRHKLANRPVVVVISDGGLAGVDEATALAAADRLKAAGIAVISMGLGTEDDVDEALLTAIASGHGLYISVADASGIALALENLFGGRPTCPANWWDPWP